ncbi:hypothetical protein Afil01_55520 [Actinorhabdospora filicis]|uniref:LPXTG-motif cell wall-anchored protein n=1 Tax=Actinorhabdospora filicis TaxID=1785913 RepID=A0A9W6SRQ5_9ACTN|nr:LPXTG cell wall anchor domain-containing protein [Actinorhabdospora filicis]GLZ80745.1 hypothetical protein Afil01_55520 [Actinorhabdospora filicis]
MKTFTRISAVAGTAFALLLGAPALAQAAEGNTGPTCDVAASKLGGTEFHGSVKIADFCRDAEGDTLKAVSVTAEHGAIKSAVAADGLSVAIDVDHMDLNREYVARITVTDGTDTATLTWATVVDPRGTEPAVIEIPATGTTYKGRVGGPGDSLDIHTFSLEKIVHGKGELKIAADGSLTYTYPDGVPGMEFYYRVTWQSKYNGPVFEVRKATIIADGPTGQHPSKPATDKGKGENAANGKDKLAQTGSPVPAIAAAGAGALALGGAGLWLTRRRKAA